MPWRLRRNSKTTERFASSSGASDLVDLNVVLYAINTAAAHHVEAHTWWKSALNGDEPVGLAWSVVTGFLRLSTHAAALPRPLTIEQACRRVNHWLGQPPVRLVLAETGTGGNLTSDATSTTSQ